LTGLSGDNGNADYMDEDNIDDGEENLEFNKTQESQI